MKEKTKESVVLGIRIYKEDAEKIKLVAKQENRSISNYIKLILKINKII
jgi:hypothetical protein